MSGGIFYLYVTSATDHNFQACVGATPYEGTIDDLFTLPTMDRRCILGTAYTAANNAIVGVYADTKSRDLAAAKAFCDANGGSESG